MAQKKMITVIQYASAIRREGTQKRTLVGLGLGKIGRSRQLEDTAAVRGMVAKVSHMVKVVE